jgi:hypothetical protein
MLLVFRQRNTLGEVFFAPRIEHLSELVEHEIHDDARNGYVQPYGKGVSGDLSVLDEAASPRQKE